MPLNKVVNSARTCFFVLSVVVGIGIRELAVSISQEFGGGCRKDGVSG